jgi:hypothetical protein
MLAKLEQAVFSKHCCHARRERKKLDAYIVEASTISCGVNQQLVNN